MFPLALSIYHAIEGIYFLMSLKLITIVGVRVSSKTSFKKSVSLPQCSRFLNIGQFISTLISILESIFSFSFTLIDPLTFGILVFLLLLIILILLTLQLFLTRHCTKVGNWQSHSTFSKMSNSVHHMIYLLGYI